LVILLLHRTRYPGPWYLRTIIVAMAAELLWLPLLHHPNISRLFMVQGLGFALLLLAVAVIASLTMTAGLAWPMQGTWSRSPTFLLYRVAIAWAFRAACVGVLLSIIWLTIDVTIVTTKAYDTDGAFLFLSEIMVGSMTSTYAVLAILPYSILLLFWLRIVRRHPAVEATPMRRLLTTLVLALPMVAVILYRVPFFVDRPWDWGLALSRLPRATLTCWGAIWLSRWEGNIQLTRGGWQQHTVSKTRRKLT
jgi:hypothetical protein